MNKRIVIIPTYNEIENIEAILLKVLSLDPIFDVLIVDDGSPDGTAQQVKRLQKANEGRIHLLERKGKLGLGTAYIEGFKIALDKGYDFIFEMDADFSHNPDDLVRLFKACATPAELKAEKLVESEAGNGDMSIGSRYIKGVNVVNWPMSRVLMSYFAGFYVRFITGMKVQDATAGFVCYRRHTLETLPLNQIKFIGYAFQVEMKFTTWKYGFKLVEVPIIFTDRTKGTSKMSANIFKEAIFGVIQMKVNSLFKRYQA
ncbi:polyprenol monophosphomannose synthase [Aquirufa sp.]|jgi:dolichol-phosphate mannosyltransferase|uniref:polyprenol monophosphomannose synthase n=1 Tax=Aquirufa sp. TaxID=2676249 RepID=UPI003784B0DD